MKFNSMRKTLERTMLKNKRYKIIIICIYSISITSLLSIDLKNYYYKDKEEFLHIKNVNKIGKLKKLIEHTSNYYFYNGVIFKRGTEQPYEYDSVLNFNDRICKIIKPRVHCKSIFVNSIYKTQDIRLTIFNISRAKYIDPKDVWNSILYYSAGFLIEAKGKQSIYLVKQKEVNMETGMYEFEYVDMEISNDSIWLIISEQHYEALELQLFKIDILKSKIKLIKRFSLRD